MEAQWRMPPGSEARAMEARSSNATHETTAGNSETILVVEDDARVRGLIARILEQGGYQVLTADSPEKAQTIATEHGSRIDLLVTDVVMPGGRGPEVAKRLTRIHQEAKTLYVSGHDPEEIYDGQIDSRTQFLAKPFSASGLALKVRKILDSKTV